ncbi:hypothetical protein B0F90DRAFT_1696229 [Multifurca ochricompacta]|uniref:Uncharacterized protein n=1 Tax=Multifurca ochricompacta TaxID=376703 RepID=A0AAD4M9M7_9AGAM|nr:hypothetical protein B0F90DRAFT_1696229 [Multifurca ochricompacta]
MSYDLYEEGSRFLSPSPSTPRKSPSKHTLARNRSNASLRGGTSSLAHELAVALLPEPTTGSKLLAAEFGIEYDEGAEGIDGLPPQEDSVPTFAISGDGDLDPSMTLEPSSGSTTPMFTDEDDLLDPTFHTPPSPSRSRSHHQAEVDPMSLLSQNLESTEKFLAHLRRLDTDGSASLALEGLAADIISRLNETARDREEQVRELLKYEREFQRIAAEVGGADALASLEALEDPRGLLADASSSVLSAPAAVAPSSASDPAPNRTTLVPVAEEPSFSQDWEVDLDMHHRHDLLHHHPDGAESDVDIDSSGGSPLKDSFIVSPPPPSVLTEPATPAGAIPHLAHLRTHTASLVSSLTALSEHAQVNGAATTEAGRKIRALKNKLGGWRTEWDSAERSRVRIERWEMGGDVEGARRVDGRAVVAEHLREFERVLLEANLKTQAIMAPS